MHSRIRMRSTMWKDIIEEILRATGWSEKELADVSGTSQPTINRLRRGKIKDTRSVLADSLRRIHSEQVKSVAA